MFLRLNKVCQHGRKQAVNGVASDVDGGNTQLWVARVLSLQTSNVGQVTRDQAVSLWCVMIFVYGLFTVAPAF